MPLRLLLLSSICLCFATGIRAQRVDCPLAPPVNLWLADSPYPIYHQNSYGQASSCYVGPEADDEVTVKIRTDITGGTSPWIYLSESYPNGERTILYSNSTHVFKFLDTDDGLVAVDSFRLDFNTLRSNGYNHLLSRNRIWFSYEPTYEPSDNRYSRLFKFSDSDPDDPYSSIVNLDVFNFGDYGINRVNMYNLNYDGQIVWYSERDPDRNVAYAGVIDQDFNLLDTLVFPTLPNERVNHNSISVDEHNAFYIVTSHRLIQFAWDGEELTIGWQALYDFVNDGPTGNFAYGSGTTPTLLGWGTGNDKLVVVADGHASNNLVAFWRELPQGWTGIPGQPLHFAGSIAIPSARSFSNLFQSIENSPTAYGYEVAIAQFNGFLGYGCDNLKGVQKFRWNTEEDKFELLWVNDEVNINGVLCYAVGSGLLYGSGKEEDCVYYYYGLDWESGETRMRLPLGREGTFPDDPFYDQGVNQIIDEEGSIYYSGSRSLVKIERTSIGTPTSEPNRPGPRVYPNPVGNTLQLDNTRGEVDDAVLYRVSGGVARRFSGSSAGRFDFRGLRKGIYYLSYRYRDRVFVERIVKN